MWLFGESLEPSQSKRWMIALGIRDSSPVVLNFDRDLALKTIENGGGIIDLASDSIYEWLNASLQQFGRQTYLFPLDELSDGVSEADTFAEADWTKLVNLDSGNTE